MAEEQRGMDRLTAKLGDVPQVIPFPKASRLAPTFFLAMAPQYARPHWQAARKDTGL